mmetsp:Transcript_2075/g.6167  ORF Transcript_2075/g.6167 Transcript_2075/m.6167 type:complete len:208 (-) Transcript_2075:356-979(-)
MGVTSFKHGHRYYGRVQRGGLARDERLQRQYDGAAGNHRVLCLVRHRSVASLAVDHNLEGSCPGHQRANSACHLPRVQPGPDVHGKHCINPFHDTFVHHQLTTGAAFLRWLEQKLHSPLELLLSRLQQICRSEQHRHVSIVSAGMHVAVILAFVWHLIGFPDWQGVHVSPQCNRWTSAAANGANHTCPCHWIVVFEPQLVQVLADQG